MFYGWEEPGKYSVPNRVLWFTGTGQSWNRKCPGKTEKTGIPIRATPRRQHCVLQQYVPAHARQGNRHQHRCWRVAYVSVLAVRHICTWCLCVCVCERIERKFVLPRSSISLDLTHYFFLVVNATLPGTLNVYIRAAQPLRDDAAAVYSSVWVATVGRPMPVFFCSCPLVQMTETDEMYVQGLYFCKAPSQSLSRT